MTDSDYKKELADVLAKLSLLFPTMRFGQIAEMVACSAGEEHPGKLESVDDPTFIGIGRQSIAERSSRLKVNVEHAFECLHEEKRLVVLAIEALEIYEDFGPWFVRSSRSVGSNSYDLEDSEFLDILEGELERSQLNKARPNPRATIDVDEFRRRKKASAADPGRPLDEILAKFKLMELHK